MLLGKGLAYFAMTALVSLGTMLVFVQLIGVPDLASGSTVAFVFTLVIAASLALGALVAALSDSERQVVQLSLFLLLASVFFGGFILSVDEFHPAAQVISYLLPVTHGIQVLQNAMLRGQAQPGWEIDALGVMFLVFSLLSWRLVRRTIAQA